MSKLACPPQVVNDRLATMRLPLSYGKKFATIVRAYAPTMTNPDETEDSFYEDLGAVISAVPAADKLLSARVGFDSASWKGVLGKHGTRKCNSNGLLLLQPCAKHDVLITNTVFRLHTWNKTSWMHPSSRHWHLICHRQEEGQAGCKDHQGLVQCRMLDRPPPHRVQGQHPRAVQVQTAGQEGAEANQHHQAERRPH